MWGPVEIMVAYLVDAVHDALGIGIAMPTACSCIWGLMMFAVCFGSADPGVFWSGGCSGDVVGIAFGLEFSLMQKLEERFLTSCWAFSCVGSC